MRLSGFINEKPTAWPRAPGGHRAGSRTPPTTKTGRQSHLPTPGTTPTKLELQIPNKDIFQAISLAPQQPSICRHSLCLGPGPSPRPGIGKLQATWFPLPTLAVAWQRLCSPDKCISPRSQSCQRSLASAELRREGEMKCWGLAGPGTVFQAEAQCRPRKARSATHSGD